MKHRIFFIAFLLSGIFTFAQEGLRPMHANPNYFYPDLKTAFTQKQNLAAKTTTGSLSLPFFDDFYYACNSAYPSMNLWMDSSVYINTGMAKAPLSIGVATFDGLNKQGFPYAPNLVPLPTSGYDVDTLTSQPINVLTSGSQTLQVSDSVALIFYYQQTGNGDSPEIQDSLMVDFFLPNPYPVTASYTAASGWISKVWSLKGNLNPNGTDTVFKRVFIWLDSAKYFQDGFKFRFRNKASANGNYDNWNIDYVYLDKGRSKLADTAWNDLTIGYVPSSFLKNYSAMPWYQYNANTSGEMATNYSNFIRFNGTSTVNTTYEYRAYDQSNTQVSFVSYGAANLPPFKAGGWQHTNVHRTPNISYTFAPLTDSTDFTIKHYMQSIGGDIQVGNDTVYQKQHFKNYYAYDDGTCETGYYVLGTGGRMAYRYQLNVTDTLRGMRIYFDPVGSISSYTNPIGSYKFRINVYTDGGSGPSNVKIFTSDSLYPNYLKQGINKFCEYKFASPLVLNSGVYYIGFQQYVSSGITIGFDRNYNFSQNLYYDSGSGWTQSSYYGSLMMRPVFGPKIDPVAGVEEYENSSSRFKVYPNPASDLVMIEGEGNFTYTIHSMDGKLVRTGNTSEIHTADLNNGLYILVISSQNLPTGQANKVQHRQKLIIQH